LELRKIFRQENKKNEKSFIDNTNLWFLDHQLDPFLQTKDDSLTIVALAILKVFNEGLEEEKRSSESVFENCEDIKNKARRSS
jgi:hypothetical protein